MMLRGRGFPTLRITLAAVLLALVTSDAGATIRYTVSVEHPEKHIFHVSMEIPDVAGEVTVQMPAWNALYQIRDFHRSEEHTSELQSHLNLVCRLLLEKKKKKTMTNN